MKNFPVPYSNELVYSMIARAGVYQGIVSPKQLLDEVYGNRKVVATLDLPSHLHVIAQHLNKTGSFSVNHLIYKHTIFPLYAPFVGVERRDKAIELMVAKAQGAVHLMLGVAASKVKSTTQFRYCPTCAEEQLKSYGECFWMRTWYLPALPYCPQHGDLVFLDKHVDDQRHQYFALSTFENTEPDRRQSCSTLARLTSFLAPLLNATEAQAISPSFEQWTFFYKNLANDLGLSRGNAVKHELIAELVNLRFNAASLQALNLSIYKDQETCWLKGLFRKHRKAFSYLQHSIESPLVYRRMVIPNQAAILDP